MSNLHKSLLDSLVYLDKDFVADRYELATGANAATTITRLQGKKAGANLLPFSAEISAQETRSYAVSTQHMLMELWPDLAEQPTVNVSEYAERSMSEFGWVQGHLSTFQVRSKSQRDGQDVVTAQSSHFQLRGLEHGRYIDLITTPDYFASGFNALLPLQMTLLAKFALPVCMYMRLLPAKDHAENWIAVPLVIVESRPTLTRDIQALL
ncbi:hypothetical protein G7047_19940 [Diaphorobacter sp. HDW4A]|uniref:hypothetical protein n=1 Tax=Diaphorobacter sp. HDW4A TaxID=2714924 RepID=UPI00140A9C5B|nr:hypothetical protein [Diaphorobacter sp. HDW4A]QIL81940.1 hypothetical protein G7047_19940 [Diaphorobacter sp. HDW4A]